ncbi:MAG: hypothetical protein GY749_06320 [Desulfobacteraceae bacterium]|nr:hypothetical protein [Desulfobacteraceae bacterium]
MIKIKKLKFPLYFMMLWTNLYGVSFANRVEIPSSPNPVGSGARAIGMGGAFIAIADDATAASWNPGGLSQLERPEISFAVSGFDRTERNSFDNSPESSGNQSVSELRINYLGAVYPFKAWRRNMVVSVNYQNLYDFIRKWDFPLISSGEKNYKNENVDYELAGSLSAFGVAYCAQVTPKFSLGFTLNFWEDGLYKNEWKIKMFRNGFEIDGRDYSAKEIRSCDRYSFSGFNMNFGLLWNVNSKFAIGGVLKTPFKADLEHEDTFYSLRHYPNDKDVLNSYKDNKKASIDMPMSYGFGAAYKFSDSFTVSLDIYRTEWDDFVFTNFEGGKKSPITGKSDSETRTEPTHQVRMGFEYVLIKPKYEIPLCAGIFYDPAPAEGSPDNIFGFSIGSGIGKGRIKLDIAYQYRFGNDIGDSVMKPLGFSQDIREHTIYSSVIIYF